jgi:hypothetical protein
MDKDFHLATFRRMTCHKSMLSLCPVSMFTVDFNKLVLHTSNECKGKVIPPLNYLNTTQ